MTKPLRTRLRLISDAMTPLTPGALFVQFTYAMLPPIPKELPGVRAEGTCRRLACGSVGPLMM